jgi:hypothetical protein
MLASSGLGVEKNQQRNQCHQRLKKEVTWGKTGENGEKKEKIEQKIRSEAQTSAKF